MKKYIYIVCLGLILANCQNLDKEFPVVDTQEEVEASFDYVKSLLTGIYADLPDGLFHIWSDTDAAMMASVTDEGEYTYEGNPVQYFNTGNWNAVNNPDMVWDRCYRGIRNANLFLLSTDNIDLDPWKLNPTASSQSIYNNYLAQIERWKYEARFLRAFFYFELVKRYGGVPLINEALPLDADFTTVKRNTLQECIDFIVDECDAIKDHLPLAEGVVYVVADDLGRATRYAAMALKSRVLLYAASELFNNTSWAGGYATPELISLTEGDRPGKWEQASDAAKELIDALGSVALGPYSTLFVANNYSLPEVIFSRRNGATNDFERFNSPIGFQSGRSGNTPSQNLVDAYEVIVNSTTTKNFDWSDPDLAANPYANRDPRLHFTVVTNNSEFGTPRRPVELWTGGIDGPPRANASKTGYYLRKYVQENLNLNQGQTGVHTWIIFRAPEIYLNYAEALNEWSPGHPDIKTYYDLVRQRGGVNMPPLATGLTQQEVREKIRHEKRVEFAFEDHRFWDVKRWMIAPEVLGSPLRAVDITRQTGSFIYQPYDLEDRSFLPRMYLYPIPQSDINIDGSLVQNPGW